MGRDTDESREEKDVKRGKKLEDVIGRRDEACVRRWCISDRE